MSSTSVRPRRGSLNSKVDNESIFLPLTLYRLFAHFKSHCGNMNLNLTRSLALATGCLSFVLSKGQLDREPAAAAFREIVTVA